MFDVTPLGYQSSLFNQIPALVHGYSTKSAGDMRKPSNQEAWLTAMGTSVASLVLGEQIHSAVAAVVDDVPPGEIAGVDGLVTGQKGITLGVVAADCAPLLLADVKKGVAAAAHAGWRGTLEGIAPVCIKKMIDAGASASDIIVSIGPHIGMCCYSVPQDRAEKFQAAFGSDPKIATHIEGTWHLDIGYVNALQLTGAGVLPEHIDAPVVCTSCQSDIFYSYRKDPKESFGEILGVIALV